MVKKNQYDIRVLLVLAVVLGFASVIYACNEAVCAVVVSKCMLTQSCKCDTKNCTCCKDCFNCLGELYSECCSCVELCPKPNTTDTGLSKKSHIEDLAEPFPELFNALTEAPDRQMRWIAFTYPAHKDLHVISAKSDKDIRYIAVSSNKDQQLLEEETSDVNCTVAFMSQCMSWNKCKSGCATMGANQYRWFHDGCCECVGSNCLNYGINDSKCLKCPIEKEQLLLAESGVLEEETDDIMAPDDSPTGDKHNHNKQNIEEERRGDSENKMR